MTKNSRTLKSPSKVEDWPLATLLPLRLIQNNIKLLSYLPAHPWKKETDWLSFVDLVNRNVPLSSNWKACLDVYFITELTHCKRKQFLFLINECKLQEYISWYQLIDVVLIGTGCSMEISLSPSSGRPWSQLNNIHNYNVKLCHSWGHPISSDKLRADFTGHAIMWFVFFQWNTVDTFIKSV